MPKDTWGLMDYDTDELIPFELLINKNGFIYRHNNEILFEQRETNEKGYQKLFEINVNDSGFFLNFNKIEFDSKDNISSKNKAWFIFKPDKMNNKIYKYKINEGDIIKIGRINIKIKEIRFEDNKNEVDSNQLNKNEINIINNCNSIKEITHIKYRNKKVLNDLRTEGSQTGIDITCDNRLPLRGNSSVKKSHSCFKKEKKEFENDIKINDNYYKNEKCLKIYKSD